MLRSKRVGDDSAYRRGTLFGFTLAEIVLLIIFALLLALTSLLLIKDKKIKELQQAESGMLRVPAGDARLADAAKDAYRADGLNAPTPEELFRELRLAKELKSQLGRLGRDGRERVLIERIRVALTDSKLSAESAGELEAAAKLIETIADRARLEGKGPLAAIVAALQSSLGLLAQNKQLNEKIAALSAQLERTKDELVGKGKHDLPPIITIPTNNYFRLGEATLIPEFRKQLIETIVPLLIRNGSEFDVQIIEVVGHTDELAIANVRSNLDGVLLGFLNGRGGENELVAGDNAGLGLSRAAAVARIIGSDPHLKKFRVLPMSAGQVVDTDQSVSSGSKPADDATRRRIEIRMRRLQ